MAAVDYKLIKNFFSKEELEIYQKYCHRKLDQGIYLLNETNFSPAWYQDALMTSLLDVKLPRVEKESNLKLFPTYSFWRYYVFGGMLKKHSDRPSCEISVTACIKKEDNWPIVIEGTSFELEEGDAILYAGCEQKHWRPGIYKGEGMAQVFLHYVNKEGPFTHHAYDNVLKNKGQKKTQEDIQILKKYDNDSKNT
jgi:hypothetical protein|tara:strand:+ start:4323 stop:4907 length:585 start_codon:yes stop_codon:yes gene_type:complete